MNNPLNRIKELGKLTMQLTGLVSIFCNARHVRQTKTKHSTWWRAHRTKWNKQKSMFSNDQSALLKHYLKYRLSNFNRNIVFLLSYKVIFLQLSQAAFLDFYEDLDDPE